MSRNYFINLKALVSETFECICKKRGITLYMRVVILAYKMSHKLLRQNQNQNGWEGDWSHNSCEVLSKNIGKISKRVWKNLIFFNLNLLFLMFEIFQMVLWLIRSLKKKYSEYFKHSVCSFSWYAIILEHQ